MKIRTRFSKRVAAIVDKFVVAHGVSANEAISELILQGARRMPVKVVNGTLIIDPPEGDGQYSLYSFVLQNSDIS